MSNFNDVETDYLNLIENAETIPIEQLEKLISFLSFEYYNNNELTDDSVYDYLFSILERRKPDSKILKEVGAELPPDVERKELPFLAPSLNKVKPQTRELELYLEKYKGPYVLSDKIDGDSAILHFKPPNYFKLYTRGKGVYGHDISFLRKYLNIPPNSRLKQYGELKIRGELSVSRKIFNSKYLHLKKPRTVITSMITSQKPDTGISFLAFELMEKLTSLEKFEKLKEIGFETPHYNLAVNLNSKILTDYLKTRNVESGYDIDGVIIANNHVYPPPKNTNNPKYMVAFKVNPTGIKTKVIDVEWNETKHGILFPRIQIEPIVIEGDIIRFVSGKNAKDILTKKIGIGAQVLVVKSGGVIPEITEVVKGVKDVKFPDCEFVWDKNKVNIMLVNSEENQNVQVKRLLHFFTSLSIERFKEGNVAKFWKSGFKTITSICTVPKEEFLKVDAIGEKMAQIIYDEVHKVIDEQIPLNKLMFASFVFDKGLGSKRLQLVIDAYPEKLYKLKPPTIDELIKIEGFSSITAKQFYEGFPLFVEFMKLHPFLTFEIKEKKKKATGGDLIGKFVVFSGFRNKELEKNFEERGAVMQSTVNGKTNLVVTNDLNSESSKIKKAKEMKIEIMLIQ